MLHISMPRGKPFAQLVIRNIERWADGLYQIEKELLLEAVKAKSHFTFDMIHWITGVTHILLAVQMRPQATITAKRDFGSMHAG
jgi:hypothetical protein